MLSLPNLTLVIQTVFILALGYASCKRWPVWITHARFGRESTRTQTWFLYENQLMPNRPDHDVVRQRDESVKGKQAFYFDRRHGVKEMSKLQPGDTVRLKTPGEKQWGKPSIVVKPYEGNEARSYVADTGNGEYRRNRRHIQIIPKCEIPPPDPILMPNSAQTLIEPRVNQPPEPPAVPLANDNHNTTVRHPIL